jgi:hypothetical protein
MKIIDAAYNAIKRRHNDIPQDPLPLGELEVVNTKRKSGSKQRSPRSIRFVKCPKCLADKATGVIKLADGSEVFRDHNKVLNSGMRIQCSGSGKVAPDDH